MSGYPYPDALWVLHVPEATPSLNTFVNKRSQFIYGKVRNRWLRHLRDAWYVAREGQRIRAGWAAPSRAKLTVHRSSLQLLDPDNLVGGVKPVLDALRKLGFIADDTPARLQLEVRQARAPTGSTLLVLDHWREACDLMDDGPTAAALLRGRTP